MIPTKHILIVDDSKDIHGLLGVFFAGEGYEISVAETGMQALELLRKSPLLPDLILLDLMMPVMDGYGFRAEQEKDARLAEIPVVIMTAGADAKVSALRAKAHGFLKKPFSDLELLLATVSGALN